MILKFNLRLFMVFQFFSMILLAENCNDTLQLNFKWKFTNEEFSNLENLRKLCRNDLENKIISNTLQNNPPTENRIDLSNNPKNEGFIQICQFANEKTNHRYENLCNFLDENPSILNKWKIAYNSKGNRILTGVLMMGVGIVGAAIAISAAQEDCADDEICKAFARPHPIIGIPSGILIYWGLFRMITSGDEISDAVKITDRYYYLNNK